MKRAGLALVVLTLLEAGIPTAELQSLKWIATPTGVKARLRGLSARSDRVVWASGDRGTIIRTTDGGATWRPSIVPDARALDFRDIDAVGDGVAYALSIGPGDASRIYKTTDAGTSWTLQFRNDDADAFYDAMAFRDANTGFAVSDSVGGHLIVLTTSDGGAHWTRIAAGLPPALEGEGAYAASGTNVAIHEQTVWFATTASRVIRSADGGRSWGVANAPLPAGASAGIFSIAFRDGRHGLVVGGDYKNERGVEGTAAISSDGGTSWTAVRGLGGFRSAVAFLTSRGNAAIAVGPSGSDYSGDGGMTWRAIEGPGFHTVSVSPASGAVWAAGEDGSVARLDFSR